MSWPFGLLCVTLFLVLVGLWCVIEFLLGRMFMLWECNKIHVDMAAPIKFIDAQCILLSYFNTANQTAYDISNDPTRSFTCCEKI